MAPVPIVHLDAGVDQAWTLASNRWMKNAAWLGLFGSAPHSRPHQVPAFHHSLLCGLSAVGDAGLRGLVPHS